MALRAVFGSITALLSLVGIALGFIFTYIPWLETDDGDFVSINGGYNQCQNEIVAIFNTQDCADVESLWLAGNGCCGLSLIVLIFSLILVIMPSRKSETIIVSNTQNNSQMWSTNCPQCGATNIGNIEQMKGEITCGGCGLLHSPVSLEKYDPQKV